MKVKNKCFIGKDRIIDANNVSEVLDAISLARYEFTLEMSAIGRVYDGRMMARHDRWIREYIEHPYTQFAQAFVLMLNDTLNDIRNEGKAKGYNNGRP